MISRLPDIVINKDAPFDKDKLDRTHCAENLTNLVSRLTKGCVLAINGEWGCGKTTFIKMWQQYLSNKGFRTLYFNAWESDFIEDPITALLGELKGQMQEEKCEESFKSLLNTGGKILLAATLGTLKSLAGQKLGDIASEALSSATDPVKSLFEKKLDEYCEKKKDIKQFKKSLEEFANNISNNKPLIFFVDELDRCAPAYSVKVLERIKHLFAVPGIVFVLSIDKTELANAVRGYYGSDLIDAEDYLRRFIDIEYNLPEPSVDAFCAYMLDTLNICEAISYGRSNSISNATEGERFIKMAKALCENKHLSLRQMEKFFIQTELALMTLGCNEKVMVDVLFLLAYLRCFENEVYIKIYQGEYDIPTLVSELFNTLPKALCTSTDEDDDEDEIITLHTIAYILILYANYIKKGSHNNLIEESGTNKQLSFKVAGFNEKKMLDEINAILEANNHRIYSDLSNILNRVEFVVSLA